MVETDNICPHADDLYCSSSVQSDSVLVVSYPSPAESTLTPVEQESLPDTSRISSAVPATFTKELDNEEVMLGRSTKVYASPDSTALSLQHFRLRSPNQSSDNMSMQDPPPPSSIAMSNLGPQEPSETLNRTLHQVGSMCYSLNKIDTLLMRIRLLFLC